MLGVGDAGAVEMFKPAFDRLDVLMLSQGIVLYGRREFEIDGFRRIVDDAKGWSNAYR
jgi:3-oxoacyl-[acyl-carrier protein] reductase